MKRFRILLLAVLLITVCTWAEDKNTGSTTSTVELQKRVLTTQGEDKRSLSIDPRATYDASTLYLYAPLEWENVEVTLYDAYGSVLFTEVVTLSPIAYRIELDGFGVKDFMVELVTDEAGYYGEFSL